MPFDPLEQTIAAYDGIAGTYAARCFENHDIGTYLETFVLSLPKYSSVLDAGCGAGRDIRYLNDKAIDCIGIDLSSGLLEEARLRVPEGYFRAMDVRYLEYPPSFFGGILCNAVINHLFEEDLLAAITCFHRVLQPNGILGLTLKTGSGYSVDKHGRTFKYYKTDEIIRLLSDVGFHPRWTNTNRSADGCDWLQLNLSASKPTGSYELGCPFCSPTLFPNNRTSAKPIAASILWGDNDIFAAVDCSPLIEGHLLLITCAHAYSFMSSQVRHSAIRAHKLYAEHVLSSVYNRRPLFLEHGTTKDADDPHSCIDHAHIHALPLSRGLKHQIETSLGPLSPAFDDEAIRGAMSQAEYISYQDKAGEIFFKSSGLEQIESQFFRIVVGEALNLTEFKWAPILTDQSANKRFDDTIRSLTSFLDAERLGRPIVSRILESRKVRLFTGSSYRRPDGDTLIVSSIRKKIAKRRLNTTLGELGEDFITKEVIYPAFDTGYADEKRLGDDAAVIAMDQEGERLVVTTDPCPRPVVFDLGDANFRYYGWLSLVISVSDLAAMGAEPLGAVISCEMREDMPISDFLDFVDGVRRASDRFRCRVVGGNIKDAEKFNVTSTAFGKLGRRRPLRRVGARPGDAIFAVGTMGRFWSGVLRAKHNLLLPVDEQAFLDEALRYPEPNLWAAIELSKSGLVSACMDASDGPTACFVELAERNNVDIVVERRALVPSTPVASVAQQLGIDPQVLMLTWGNWEIVFTANREELLRRVGGHPIREEINFLGNVVSGTGRVFLDRVQSGRELPDLSSRRFSQRSSFSHGLDAYADYIGKLKL